MKRYRSLILTGTITLLLLSCGRNNNVSSGWTDTLLVETLTVGDGSMPTERNYVGDIGSEQEVSLSFPLGGTLTKVAVKNGDYVVKGQLLAEVDATSATSIHATALATLHQAEDAHRRLEAVHREGGLSEVKWVEMETNLEKARSMEQIARKQLDDCTLYAPFSGVVGRCNAEAGRNVLSEETVLALLDMKQVFVTFAVPESEIPSVAVGDRVQVKVPVLNERVMDGRVAERSVKSNRLSHSYQFKVALSNPSSDLLPGMVSKVYLAQKNIRGYIIPAKAVQTRPEGQSIWVVHNGLAVRRPIGASEFAGNGILITDGLNFGDTVIVEGCQKLYDNAKLIIHQ